MNTLMILGVTSGVVFGGCAAEPEQDGELSSAQQHSITSGPAITQGGNSSARILVPSPAGPGVEINGSPDLGSFLIASYEATTGSSGATAGATVTPAPGAAFVYTLLGSGTGYSGRQLRLQRTPGSSDLTAAAATGNVACGTVASGAPTKLGLVFHAASGTFDVLIGGAASECTSLPTKLLPPVIDGWGGRVDFTDLTLF
jgi:hypothetical protein